MGDRRRRGANPGHDPFFDLADAIIIARRLIREAWTTYRWDIRPAKRP